MIGADLDAQRTRSIAARVGEDAKVSAGVLGFGADVRIACERERLADGIPAVSDLPRSQRPGRPSQAFGFVRV